jgi:hypothetical protein
VPNYELAPDLQQVDILRVVVRENMTEVVCAFVLALSPSLVLIIIILCHLFVVDRPVGH